MDIVQKALWHAEKEGKLEELSRWQEINFSELSLKLRKFETIEEKLSHLSVSYPSICLFVLKSN